MDQIIQLCYLVTISIAISSFSMQILARGKNLAAFNPLIKSGTTTLFLLFILVFNFCDFLLLFLGSTIEVFSVNWILVVENVLEVCMAYALIEMEREYFQLKEKKSRFIFFTVTAAVVLWIDAAYTAGIMFVGEGVYMTLMLALNCLPVLAIFVFTVSNLRKILHPGRPTVVEGYFLLYNLVFFVLCVATTLRIADSRTVTDYVGNDKEIYVIFWFLFNVMNFLLIWHSCQTVGEKEEDRTLAAEKTPEEKILQAKLEYGLSDREVEIARLLCKGKNNNDIASDLFVSPNTVKVHTSNLYRKLSVKNRVQAVQVLRGESIERDTE